MVVLLNLHANCSLSIEITSGKKALTGLAHTGPGMGQSRHATPFIVHAVAKTAEPQAVHQGEAGGTPPGR